MHSHTQHRTPHYIHNTWHHSPNSPFVMSLGIACVVLVYVLCVFCVCVVCVLCVVLCCVCIVRVLGSVVCVFRVVSVVCGLVSRRHQSRRPSSRLCRLVAVALCLCVLCVMRFLVHTPAYGDCVSCVCVVCVLGSAVSRLLEHVIRNQSSGFWEEYGRKPESGVVGLVCPVFCCGPRSMITYVVLMSSFHVELLSSCHVLCWWRVTRCLSRESIRQDIFIDQEQETYDIKVPSWC